MSGPAGTGVDFVIKISKYCNLRCRYCYEFTELGNRQRMSLGDLRSFFIGVKAGLREQGRTGAHFVWHGGEPFLIPLAYYEQIGELQRETLGEEMQYRNLVQTNLTVLTERHIEFVRSERFFLNSLGVSFDVYGDQRIDAHGALRTDTVLANLERLRANQVHFGAITVLARNTLPRVADIFRFYELLGISVRFLPFYKNALDSQIDEHALTFAEITGAFKLLFDLWLVSESAPAVHPLEDYMRYALSAVQKRPPQHYLPQRDEQVFLVDCDGSTYGVADTYDPARRYGNLFREDFSEVCRSPNRERAMSDASARIERHCVPCRYFGHCPGRFAAEATVEQRRLLEQGACPVREIVSHIAERLDHPGILERLRPAAAGIEQSALGVAG